MAASIDFSKMNHLLGSIEYDADMDIVETMVRAHNEPENVLAQASLFNYYISRILNYWNLAEIYVNSSKFQQEQISHPEAYPPKLFSKSKFDLSKISEYRKQLFDKIDDVTAKYQSSSKVEVIEFVKVFRYVSDFLCGIEPAFDKYYSSDSEFMYPLPNTVGIFAINTYLYAAMHGVLLLGVPVKNAFYDGNYGCPGKFVDHDIEHTLNCQELYSDPQFDRYVTLYYKIINDDKTTFREKELYLLTLWIAFHEFPLPVSELFELNYDSLFAWNNIGDTIDPEYYEAFEKFRDLIEIDDAADKFLSYIEKTKKMAVNDRRMAKTKKDRSNLNLVISDVKDLINVVIGYIANEQLEQSDILKVYTVMSLWKLNLYAQ